MADWTDNQIGRQSGKTLDGSTVDAFSVFHGIRIKLVFTPSSCECRRVFLFEKFKSTTIYEKGILHNPANSRIYSFYIGGYNVPSERYRAYPVLYIRQQAQII